MFARCKLRDISEVEYIPMHMALPCFLCVHTSLAEADVHVDTVIGLIASAKERTSIEMGQRTEATGWHLAVQEGSQTLLPFLFGQSDECILLQKRICIYTTI